MRWGAFVAVALSTVAVFSGALWLGSGQSVWFDESYSITLAQRPVSELLALTAVDAHPPLYYLLLKAWAGVFGWSENALRSLSALAAAATVPAVYGVVRRLIDRRAALISLPFVALSAYSLRYGYEIRMYALTGLIGAVGTLLLVIASASRRRWLWLAYAVVVAAGMYTLYVSAALWLTHALWLSARWRRTRAPLRAQYGLGALVLAAALFVPYLPTVWGQVRHTASSGIAHALNLDRLLDLTTMALTYTPEWKVDAWTSLVFLAAGAAVLLLVRYADAVHDYRAGLALIAGQAVIPLAFMAALSLPPMYPIFVNRYLAWATPWVFASIAILVALAWRSRRRLVRIAAAALALTVLSLQVVGVVQLHRVGNYNFDALLDPQISAARQATACGPGDVVVADTPRDYLNVSYHFADCDLRFASADPVPFTGGLAPLADSTARIASAADLDSDVVTVIHSSDRQRTFTPDGRYHLVNTQSRGSEILDRFERVD